MEGERKRVRMPSPPPEGEAMKKKVILDPPQERALRNEYILKEVMSFLPVEDLKQTRFVSKLWHDVATRELAPRAPVLRFGYQGLGMGDIVKIMDIMAVPANFPVGNFALNSDFLWGTLPEQKRLLPRFVERVAPYANHLHLITGNNRFFPLGKPKKGTEFLKLKSLSLYIICSTSHRHGRRVVESNVDFMISILQHSPKLETVSLGSDFAEEAENAAFMRVLEHVPWSRIRHLQLRDKVGVPHLLRILELGGNALRLKSLEWRRKTVWAGDIPVGTTLRAVLEHQQRSLVSIKLGMFCVIPEHRFTLPRMANVTKLELELCLLQDAQRLAPSFAQQFPALRSLCILKGAWSGVENFLRNMDVHPAVSVRELELRRLSGNDLLENWRARGIIRHLGIMFPRLEKLGVPLHPTLLDAMDAEYPTRTFLNVWAGLDELVFFSGHMDVDLVFTGYSEGECLLINQMPEGSPLLQLVKRATETKIHGFLHKVRKLEISNSCCYAAHVTDTTCRLVILQLKALERVTLPAGKVTEGVVVEMRKKVKVSLKKDESSGAEYWDWRW